MHAELFTFTPFASNGDGFNLSATVKDGQPWFIAADVCRSLGIKNASHAMARLDDDEKALQKCMTLGGAQEAYIINESGLYALVCASSSWITDKHDRHHTRHLRGPGGARTRRPRGHLHRPGAARPPFQALYGATDRPPGRHEGHPSVAS